MYPAEAQANANKPGEVKQGEQTLNALGFSADQLQKAESRLNDFLIRVGYTHPPTKEPSNGLASQVPNGFFGNLSDKSRMLNISATNIHALIDKLESFI